MICHGANQTQLGARMVALSMGTMASRREGGSRHTYHVIKAFLLTLALLATTAAADGDAKADHTHERAATDGYPEPQAHDIDDRAAIAHAGSARARGRGRQYGAHRARCVVAHGHRHRRSQHIEARQAKKAVTAAHGGYTGA
jgi:hypothetical protein